VLDRAGLARKAAAGDGADDVVLADAVGDRERLVMISRSVGRAKNTSWSRPLTVTLPVPGLSHTRATASLRRPVA
jgi:hypothetical protein